MTNGNVAATPNGHGATAPDLILGTAGHIDHGKSSLVLALTGTDPDRLAAEKQRGITIELGFAQLVLPSGERMGVVDVPGHERFVRQMIAGSTGIDVALLCIAADDGVMPQTEEHLAVLTLLGVPTCVVALTKCDLVDEEWRSFVGDEVRSRLMATPYADGAIVEVSSKTGEGLDELKAAIEQAAKATRRRGDAAAFRLPVDRSFTIKGAGTVVTGTLWSGQVRVGDEVEILPAGTKTRVRSIQVHGQAVDAAASGHRTALNLNGVSTDDVRPGDMLAAPGTIRPSDHFDVDLTYLGVPGSDKALESGARVHVAHGTREVIGRVLLMDAGKLAPGAKALAQLRTEEDLSVSRGDRFIIRSYSPVHVIGGGEVLRAHPRRSTNLTQGESALVEALRSDDEVAAAAAVLEDAAWPLSAEDIARAAELDPAAAQEAIAKLVDGGRAVKLGPAGRATQAEREGATLIATKRMLQKMDGALENALLKFHAANPEATGASKESLRSTLAPACPAPTFDALLSHAAEAGRIVVDGGEVSHPEAGAGARKKEEQTAAALLAALEDAGATPPATKELIAQVGATQQVGYKALGALERDGRAVKVSDEFYFAASALDKLAAAVRDELATGAASAAELKDAMGTTRKYAIPLLEHFDAIGLTRRAGEARELVE